MTVGNGIQQAFEYNDRLQMKKIAWTKNNSVIQRFDYSFGQIDPQSGSVDTTKNNGQLAQVESYIGGTASSPTKQFTQKFSYDSIGRLEKENEYRGDNGNQVYQQKFSFDRFGNRYLKASENPSNQNPLVPTPIEDNNIERATNRFAANTGTVYDDAGNVVSDDKFREMDFVYDANGRMAKATRANFPGALSVFDAGGNKVATRVNDVWRFQIYDAGGKCVAEYGGPQSADDGGVKYTHQDVQGSTRTISTQAGFAQARMDYQAFGEQISSGIGQRTATGYTATDTLRNRYALTERDEATGLDDTWFRKLENRGGRWTSPDPYNGSALVGNPQSFNRYGYVENQPTNYVDPSGLFMIGPRPPAPREQGWLEICWLLGICGNPTSVGSEDMVVGGGSDGNPDPPSNDKCTLTIYVSAVALGSGSSGSSSGSSSAQRNRDNPSEGKLGIINHLYLTYHDSSNGLTVGFRGGPVTVNKNESDRLLGTFGLYQKGAFSDFEINPQGAAVEEYDENCDKFDKSFKETIAILDKANIAYSKLSNNSNAFLYTLLNRAGINADSFTPRINYVLGRFGTAVGWGTTVPIQ